MDDMYIIAVFTIIADVMQRLGHRDHVLAGASDAEVLTVAVVAAKYFQNHHARALEMLHRLHYLSGPLSPSLQPAAAPFGALAALDHRDRRPPV